MKAGFCLHGDWLATKPDLVRRIDELGYDGVEIWAQAFDAIGLDGVKRAIAPYKFEVASVNPYFDFTTSEETWEESLRIADTFISYARQLNCERVRTFTSKMDYFKSSDEAEPIHWDRTIRGIREVCDRASKFGIKCVLESHYGDGQLCDSSDAVMRILRGVGRPNLTVNLQPPLRGEDPLESARRLGPYVAHLHAHNWIGGWGNFTFLDDKDGDVDFRRFLEVLRGYGFDGYVSIEHASRDPFGFAEHNIEYLRRLFREMGG
ncbi:MAG: sugar phosphate isomerase/epimerase family protein [bacterium]